MHRTFQALGARTEYLSKTVEAPRKMTGLILFSPNTMQFGDGAL